MVKFLQTSIKKVKKKVKDSVKKDQGPLFSITEDEMDVVINREIGGKWKGFLFSQLREDWEGQRLLNWIIEKDFDKDVKEIAKNMLNEI